VDSGSQRRGGTCGKADGGATVLSSEGLREVADIVGDRDHGDSAQTRVIGRVRDRGGAARSRGSEFGDDDVRSTGVEKIRDVRHHIEAGRRQLVREARADFFGCDREEDERRE